MAKVVRCYCPDHPLFGILNPYGQFWTHEVFTTQAAAKARIDAYWPAPDDRRGFAVIPVRMSIEDARLPAPHRGEGEEP